MNGRYLRQTALPEVGVEGQTRLGQARVLVMGAGGLGCPVLLYLAGAGVGYLRIVDGDRVELGNLHRQVLYGQSDLGRYKVEAARDALLTRNPEIRIEARAHWLQPGNVADLIEGMDLVVDAGDNRAVTYVLDDACSAAGVPLVSASALELHGHVGVFCGRAPSYRAVFPEMPQNAANCNTSGVLGPIVGLFGSLQAQLALQLLLDIQPDPSGILWRFDARRGNFSRIDFSSAPTPEGALLHFLCPEELPPEAQVLELRSAAEALKPVVPGALRVLPGELVGFLSQLDSDHPVVPACQAGLRAWRAARQLQEAGFSCPGVLAMDFFRD